MKKRTKLIIVVIVGFVVAMILMSVFIYFGYNKAYNTGVESLTVKTLGIPIYEIAKSGTKYVGKTIGLNMGIVCGICMMIAVATEEIITRARQ